MRADDMILISVDDHIAEPPSMFDAHVPAKYKDQAPRVVETDDGRQQWFYGDIEGRLTGLNAVAGKPRELYNADAARFDEMRPGCYDVEERVRDMNAGGQLAGLNFPNWTGFSGQVLSQGPDRAVNLVMIQAYNDWHIDEWCGAHPDRFIPCGLLPLFDADAAATEIRRLASKGCHAVTFSENPEALQLPSIHSGYWDPVFGACSDVGTVLCLHLGSSSQPITTSSDAPASVPMSLLAIRTVYTLVELLWSDLWTRFGELRVSLTEGDIGWMPYFVQRCEHTLERHSGWTKADFGESGGPDQVFRKHILSCFIEDRVGVELLHRFNVDNVCWESDYPHSDGNWPNAPERLEELFKGVSDEIVNKITHENAARHYQFDPFAKRSRGECTVSALRAEAGDVDTSFNVGRLADERDVESIQRYFENRRRAAVGGS